MGAGIYATGNAQLRLEGTVVERNRAGENGGGIRISYATNLEMSGGRIADNQSNVIGTEHEGGGGLAARNASFHLQGVGISNNVANHFAGGGVYCNSAFEGGFNTSGFIANRHGQFDDIMRNDYRFGMRVYHFSDCQGSDNRALGRSGAGGFVYAVRVEGNEHLEVRIRGAATAVGQNTSEYNNPNNRAGTHQKRGEVVIELSGRRDAGGLPEDRVSIFGDVRAVPTGIASSVPTPNNRAVVIIHHGGRTDDHPITFPYSNVAFSIIDVQPRLGSVAGGTVLSITGEGFVNDPGTQVFIGGQLAGNIQVLSEREVTAETPPGTGPGPVDIEVQNADGRIEFILNGFEYTLPPQIIDIQPRSGFVTGGDVITITGNNFLGGIEVLFGGGQATSITVISATQLEVVTPPLSAGLPPDFYDVEVINPDTLSDIVPAGFEYVPLPRPNIINVQPRSGPAAVGTPITITGSDFQQNVSVTVGGVSAVNVVLVSSSQINAETPPLPASQSPGFVDIVVTNPDGRSDQVSGGFQYLAPPPHIIDVQPRSGPAAGGTHITITGANFQSGASVTFDGISALFINFVSSSEITVETPPLPPPRIPGPVDVVVTNPDGLSDSVSGGFDYTP